MSGKAKNIKPNKCQQVGAINVEKCIAYLRGVGVEIDDRTGDSWLDAQAAHRLIGRIERKFTKVVADVVCVSCCACGDEIGNFTRRASARSTDARVHYTCGECGSRALSFRLVAQVRADQTIKDFRDRADQWVPVADVVRDASEWPTLEKDGRP